MGNRTSMLVLLLFLATTSFCFALNVTYDGRALVIDGKRRVLASGSIHYPRSAPEMWPDLIRKAKEGGLDVIDTYVFWGLHQAEERGEFDFSGKKNLPRFIKLVGQAGMYVHLRVGPYVCAEWNYGGLPVWLRYRAGCEFRTDSMGFKIEVEHFVSKLVEKLMENNLFAKQGGPIILAQIENDYGDVQAKYGEEAKPYIDWTAKLATTMNVGNPWVMCQQNDAPDPLINTCNGFYCHEFTPNSNKKPKIFTELWSGWFSTWGEPIPYRPAEDLAFSAARFYQLNGTLVNYYMYHGGTNFARTAGGPFITTSYDYDAPIDEYGLPRQPKYGHLKDLHKAIKLSEAAMVASFGKTTPLGPYLEATVYESGPQLCAAFLANLDGKKSATLNFRGKSYFLPAWSISILPDCKNVVYNTAQVNSIMTLTKFAPLPPKHNAPLTNWSWFKEPVGYVLPPVDNSPVWGSETPPEPLALTMRDQLNRTMDSSDYLWYSNLTKLNPSDALLRPGSKIQLRIESLGHALHAFVNGKLVGSGNGRVSNNEFTVDLPITLQAGDNKIDILSMTLGQKNYGPFYEKAESGPRTAQIRDLTSGRTLNLSADNYLDGIEGERMRLFDVDAQGWVSKPSYPKNTPVTWYKTTFSAPPGNSPVAIQFTGMVKGMAWVNGWGLGRYWMSSVADSNANCTNMCDYRGPYAENKCLANCGKPTQQFYHVPRGYLDPTDNDLVVFEEVGGDPTKISIVTREVDRVCGHVSEAHPVPLDNGPTRKTKPTLSLECPLPKKISQLQFVSFGNPSGTCGSFSHSPCSSKEAQQIVQKACVGKPGCSIEVSSAIFGNPCANVVKSLAVEAICS